MKVAIAGVQGGEVGVRAVLAGDVFFNGDGGEHFVGAALEQGLAHAVQSQPGVEHVVEQQHALCRGSRAAGVSQRSLPLLCCASP